MNRKNWIFVEIFFITIFLLLMGFSFGFALENYRTGKIIEDYRIFEINALDLRLQNYYYQIMDKSVCEHTIKQNFIFADQIYNTGLLLERYEESNELTESILLEKKRYVLLKTELWLNSLLLKEKCGNPFHTVVYVYAQNRDLTKEAEQRVISNVLKELKEKRGNEIILIPLAGDLNLDIVDMQLRVYNVTYFPSIIIDEGKVLEGFHSLGDIEQYLK